MIKTMGRQKGFGLYIFVAAAFIFLSSGSSALFAEDTIQIQDVVNGFAYNPDNPSAVQPIFAGDSIPVSWIIVLPSSNSKVSFSKDGKIHSLSSKGFYNAQGKGVAVSAAVRSSVNQAVQSFQSAASAGAAAADAAASSTSVPVVIVNDADVDTTVAPVSGA